MKKLKYLAAFVAISAAAVFGFVQTQQPSASAAVSDCTANSIIYCGFQNMTEFKAKFKQNATGDLGTIYAHYGLNANNIGNGKLGYATKAGTVVVDGKVVATGAHSIGRQSKSYAHPVKIGSKTYYESSSQAVFLSDTIPAYVYFDGNGRFFAAVLLACGNPMSGIPTKPAPKPPAPKPTPAASCSSLKVAKLSDTSFKFTAAAAVSGGAKVNSYTYKVTKSGYSYTKTTTASSLAYTQKTPGTYTVQVTANTTVGAKTSTTKCKTTFTVPTPPKPAATCKALTVDQVSRTKFTLKGSATTANGATVSQYIFNIYKDGELVGTKTVNSKELSASTSYTQETPGKYTVKLVVKTSAGEKKGANCEAEFTVVKPKTPSDSITKLVEGVKHKRVGVNVEFTYQIRVTNNGEVDLTNVKVTDKPDNGIVLVSAPVGTIKNNVWTTTIDKLAIGKSKDFTITAKVPVYKAGTLTNTVCVDAPEVPGTPEHCDTADVDVPRDVEVCNPETGEIITVDEDQAKDYEPVDSPKCEAIEVCVIETGETKVIKKSEMDTSKYSTNEADCVVSTPPELPRTGASDLISKISGIVSLSGATAYYIASRRNS